MNTRHFEELGFTVIAKPFSHHVEYKVFQIQGIGINPSTYYYNDSEDNPTESIEQAEVFAHGSVKWDGCSNWHFDEQDRVMIHGCCKEHLINLGLILSACWDWTADLIPETWSA